MKRAPFRKYSLPLVCFLVLALTTGTVVAAPQPSRSRAYAHFLEACLARTTGEARESVEALKKAFALDPESVFLAQELARAAIHLGDFTEAGLWAERAVTLDPSNIGIKIVLARIYTSENRLPEAMEILEEVLQESPDDQEALFLLGTLYAQGKEFPKAIETLEKVTEDQGRRSFMAHYYLGRLYRETGDLLRAEENLKAALELNPHLTVVYMDLAEVYLELGDPAKALEHYTALLALEPDNLRARAQTFRILLGTGRFDEAMEELSRLRSKAAEDPDMGIEIAILCMQLEKYEEALEILEELARSYPRAGQIRFYMALAHEKRGDLETATTLLQDIGADSDFVVEAKARLAYLLKKLNRQDEAIRMIEANLDARPGTKEWILALSALLEESNRLADAEAILRTGVEQNPDDTELLFDLVMVLDKRGQRDEAMEHAREILEIDSEHVAALNYLGYTYAEENIRLDEAENLVTRALVQRPEDGYIADSLGWVHFKKGELEKAVLYLEKARKLAPDDPVIEEHLGDAYRAKGALSEALRAYRKALESVEHAEDRIRLEQKIREVQKAVSDAVGR